MTGNPVKVASLGFKCPDCFTTDIETNFNQRELPHLIDLTASVDTVYHDILISKIARSSLPPNITRWLSCYLKGKQVETSLSGINSRAKTQTHDGNSPSKHHSTVLPILSTSKKQRLQNLHTQAVDLTFNSNKTTVLSTERPPSSHSGQGTETEPKTTMYSLTTTIRTLPSTAWLQAQCVRLTKRHLYRQWSFATGSETHVHLQRTPDEFDTRGSTAESSGIDSWVQLPRRQEVWIIWQRTWSWKTTTTTFNMTSGTTDSDIIVLLSQNGSVHKSRVTMWFVCGCSWRDDVCRVCGCYRGGDGCVLASTLCKYDLRKGDLFVLSWARVLRVKWGRLSSELIMCGGGVRSILLLPLVARCLETIDVCIWRMFFICLL